MPSPPLPFCSPPLPIISDQSLTTDHVWGPLDIIYWYLACINKPSYSPDWYLTCVLSPIWGTSYSLTLDMRSAFITAPVYGGFT